MAKPSISHTALGAAICRLIEQYQPERIRLFNDPVVKDLVDPAIRFSMQNAAMRNFTIQQTEAAGKGIYGIQVCRTRYIDDSVLAALSQGIKQLVILGAGFDTRPYRLPGLETVKVFEVDLPAIQEGKKKKIIKSFGRWPENIFFIPIDLDLQTLESAFTGTPFDPSRPAAFILEGVTQYIAEESVQRTLSFVGKTAPGTTLIFTYVLKSVIERRSGIPGANKLMDTVSRDAPWIFGFEPSSLPAILRPFHLELVEDVGVEYYQERYLRPLGRSLEVFAGERIAKAVVTPL